MPTFPDLKYSTGYSYSVEPDVIRTDFFSRNSRQRKITSDRNDTFNVRIRVDDAGYTLFDTFIIDELENGSLTFDGPYFVGNNEKTGTLEIIGGTYSASYLVNDYWDISYSFELKNRDMSDEQSVYEVVNAYNGFDPLGGVLDALALLVNENNLT